MSKGDESEKVIIIGAGPGGLLLAQLLRRANIPFEIFERDSELHSRSQGWAVALIESLPDLWELLPTDIGPLEWTSVNEGNLDYDSMSLIDAVTGERIWKFGGKAKGDEGYILRASRAKLRELFWKNINVSVGKEFLRYEEDDEGVEAFFKDGSSVRGGIVVGADGVRSRVRSQLLGEGQEWVYSKYVAVCGEGQLPLEVADPLREIGNSAVLCNAPYQRCIIGQHEYLPDQGSAKFYYCLGYRSENAEAETTRLATATKEELFDMAMELTKNWQPLLKEVIRKIGQEGMFAPPIKFLEFVPPESIPTNRVTLLGDAAHAMIPYRGAGMNTAFKDAADFTRLVVEATLNRKPLNTILPMYAESMLPRGRRMVLSSRAAGEDSEGYMKAFKETIKDVPSSLTHKWE